MPRAHNCWQSERARVGCVLHLTEFRGSVPLITSQEGCATVQLLYVCLHVTHLFQASILGAEEGDRVTLHRCYGDRSEGCVGELNHSLIYDRRLARDFQSNLAKIQYVASRLKQRN
jgi:hypothetical protein